MKDLFEAMKVIDKYNSMSLSEICHNYFDEPNSMPSKKAIKEVDKMKLTTLQKLELLKDGYR